MPKVALFASICSALLCAVKLIKFIPTICIFGRFYAPKNICFWGCVPDRPLYRVQVNLHGSPCIPDVFLYRFGHRKKTKFSTKCPQKYAILTPKSQKKFCGGGTAPSPDPSPCGKGDTPFPHPIPFGAFGASTEALDFGPPNFNSWIRLCPSWGKVGSWC